MFTVLLVDDDITILKNLAELIDWPAYVVETILTAHNGLEAVDIINSHPINLLITDISMPQMDGIQLLRHVHTEYPHIRCIVLSSYSDFAYVKEAITLNVENYLLKPLQQQELEYTIRKALDNLSMHKQAIYNLLLENILYRWVTSDISMSEFSERAKHMGINIFSQCYCALLIKPALQLSMNEFIASIILLMKASCDVWHFVNYNGIHVIILAGRSITPQMIESNLQDIISSNIFAYDLQCFVGHIVESYEDVPQSYQSALELLMANSHTPEHSILFASSYTDSVENSLAINSIIEKLTHSQVHLDTALIAELFKNLFGDITNSSIRDLNSSTSLIPAKIALQMSASGLISEMDQDAIINTAHYFETLPSQQELLMWFTNLLTTCQTLVRKHTNSLSPIVVSALRYISQNYSEPITIKDFCNHYSVNNSYFGQLFKKEIGIYFTDYLNQIRINRSIELLKHSSMKIADIYKACGFTNTSYFSLCFRRQTGITPMKYRKLYNESE